MTPTVNPRDAGREKFAPLHLPPDFPISTVDRNTRGEIPDIGPHVHDCCEVGYCHSGDGIFLVEDKILSFRAGDAALVSRRELHLLRASPGGETTWSFINLDPVGLLAGHVEENAAWLETDSFCGPDFNNILSGTGHPALAGAVRDLVEARGGVSGPGHASEIRALVWRLMILLHRTFGFAVAPPAPDREGRVGKRLMAAVEHMAENIGSAIDIPHLATLCHMSESNFRKVFSRTFNCSPKDYLLRLRLRTAEVMLVAGRLPIIEIAWRCGYRTLSNFNRQFARRHRIAPRDYRRRHWKADDETRPAEGK